MVSIGVLAPPLNSRFQIKKDIFRPTFNLQSQTMSKKWNNVKKLSKTWQGKKLWYQPLCYFLPLVPKKNFWKGDWVPLMKQCQKIKENLTGKETLVSAFVLFFTTSTKKKILEGRLGTINETMSKN